MLVNHAGGLPHRKPGAFGPQSRQKLRFKPGDIHLGRDCHTLLPSLRMNADESPLGRCPKCGEDISEAWILVEYEKDDGTEGVWTECPACEDVVAPE